VSWRDLDRDDVVAAASQVESDRFGVSLARVTVGRRATEGDDTWHALAQACDRPEDVLVVRWPSALVGCSSVLAASGRVVLPADTLTYWDTPATDLAAQPVAPDTPPVVRADQVDPAELHAAVADVFAGYVNHYAANPLLDRRLALEGYVDWVARTLHAQPGAGAVLVDGDRVLGFGTWVMDPAGEHCEFLLGGMRAESRGRGWYALLLVETARAALAAGVPTLLISTQGSNVGVQRAWARLGLRPRAEFTTAHLVRPGLLPGSGRAD
jgi:hypothetical protein